MIEVFDAEYQGFFPVFDKKAGETVILLGKKKTGFLWWKKVRYVWVVKMIKEEIYNGGAGVDIEKHWRVIDVFATREDAENFVKELNND